MPQIIMYRIEKLVIRMVRFIIALTLLLGLPLFLHAQQSEYDLIIKNGRVLDGSGNPWVNTDIAVEEDRIVAVGNLSDAAATKTVDATGKYVAPGFIDTHSHAASGLKDEDLSAARPLLAQGITSVFINPDGGGAVDLNEQRQELLEHQVGVNVAQFVPHSSIREEVMNFDDRPPEDDELAEMQQLVRAGMETGAFGISTGPFYPPGSYSDTQELIDLTHIVAEYGGAYQSHIRDESDYNIGVVGSVDEVIQIAEATGVAGIVTHIKALGPNVWGYSSPIVHRIDRARDRGIRIFADQYPYNASATSLSAALVPSGAMEGGRDRFLERMKDEERRSEIITGIEQNLERRGGAHRVVMRRVRFDTSLEGKSLEEIAENRNLDPVQTTIELLEEGSPGIVSFNMNDEDVHRLMRQPWTMTASDGGLVQKDEGVPHPRNYGSFPRKLKKYAMEERVVDLAFAVRSMTHMPAQVYEVEDRGLIREGNYADIVVFDPEQLVDPSDFQNPHQLAEGMIHVWVNGIPAITDGEFTGDRPGEILSR